ncbi:AAA family ATPase [Candidatus Woesearchaeota archaeon]|nr:AAA family ATPase [Candidatus Woesearchaeota archaeon]
MAKKNIARKIVIMSGKGGVGKTTTAINLGAALNHFGKKVTIVDANLTTPDIGVYLGVPILPITLHDVLKGKAEISEAVYAHKSGTRIIPASIALQEAKKIHEDKLEKALEKLDDGAEFILLDGAPGLGREALASLNAADEVLVVTNPELPAVTDALKTIKFCQELGKKIMGVVVTKTNVKNADMSIMDIEEILEMPVLEIIPEDRAIKFAQAQKDAVIHTDPKSAAAVQYKKLASNLIGEEYQESLPAQHNPVTEFLLRWFGFK